jgi:uncharacterized heparinase superfamily protein
LVTHRRLEAQIGAAPIRDPSRVEWHLEQVDGGIALEANHDGYRRRFDLMHSRRLQLAADGSKLSGCDRIDGAAGHKVRLRKDLPFAIHFHLYPGIECRIGDVPNEARLTLASGEHWRFAAEGATLAIEESAYFAESAGPRRALQITLRGVTFGEHEVNWVAERLFEDVSE